MRDRNAAQVAPASIYLIKVPSAGIVQLYANKHDDTAIALANRCRGI